MSQPECGEWEIQGGPFPSPKASHGPHCLQDKYHPIDLAFKAFPNLTSRHLVEGRHTVHAKLEKARDRTGES